MATKEERRAEYAAKRQDAEARRKARGHNPEPSTEDVNAWLINFGHDRCAYLVERDAQTISVYIMKDAYLTEVSGLIAFITGLEYIYTRPAMRFTPSAHMFEQKLFATKHFDRVRWL